MPTPTVVSLENFPSQVQMKKSGDEKVSDPKNSGARIKSTLNGTVITRFSLAGTNLSFDAAGTQERTDQRVFTANTTQLVPLNQWSLHCSDSTTPDSPIALDVTAEFVGQPPSAPRSATIVVKDVVPMALGMKALTAAKKMLGLDVSSKKRATKRSTKKRSARKNAAKKSAARPPKSRAPGKAARKPQKGSTTKTSVRKRSAKRR